MRIARVDVIPFNLERSEGMVNAIGDSDANITAIYVRVVAEDSTAGYGYAHPNPYIAGETTASLLEIINQFGSKLIGEDPMNNELLTAMMFKSVVFNYRAKAAIDVALYDLKARLLNLPLCQLLGGRGRTEFPAVRLVSIKAPAEMARDAEEYMRQGYQGVKIKVGLNPTEDVQRILEVRAAIGKDATLIVDPNQGYTLKTALRVFDKAQSADIYLIEQPLRIGDLAGAAMLRKMIDIPIEIDEGIKDVDDVWQVLNAQAADFISIKIMKVGGISAAKRIAALCQVANVNCLIGATPGSQIVDAANAHFLSAHPWVTTPSELGECEAMLNDPVQGVDMKGGRLHLPSGPGLGVTFNLPER